MQKLTKHDTILWINHAIANFKGLGKTQKDLALKLGIEESRLSEMKNGAGTISPVLMEQIVDLCGAPRRKPGRFENVELYSDLNSFFSLFDQVTENRFIRQLLKTFTSNAYIEIIIKNCNLEDGSYEDTNDDDKKALIIDRINELIRSEEFSTLCLEYQKELHREPTPYSAKESFQWRNYQRLKDSDGNDHLKMNGLCINDESLFHAMYLLWLLVTRVADFRFASNVPVNLNPVKDLSPVVMTGKRLLTITSKYIDNSPINKGTKALFGINENYREIHKSRYIGYSRFDQSKKVNHTPEMWREVRCELYLSENMNYHLLIHLAHEHIYTYLDLENYSDQAALDDNNQLTEAREGDRIAVITNINALDLFRQIEEIRKWCGLPQDSHYELKQQIARAGGYVPGARVLV